MIKTFDIILDIEKELYSPSNILFTVSENDLDSVDLLLTINQDEQRMDLTGSIVELAVKKPSGLTVYQECEITNAIEGEALVRLSLQSYIEYGIHMAEVYVRDGEHIAVTSAFYYSSREAIMNDETIESTNDWSVLQEALFSYDKKPLLIDGVPLTAPEYVGQMAFDTTGLRAFIANGLTAESWQLLAAGEGGGGIVYWNDVLGKPLTFAPSAHSHIIAEISGLQAALDGKLDEGSIPPAEPTDWADILNKPLTFAPAAHTHDFNSITGKPATYPPDAHTHDFNSITGKPATYTPSTHTHDFTTGITGKPATYPPSTHNHLWADITDKPTTFAPAAHTHDFTTGITGKPATYPPSTHSHTIADVTGLQASLNAKLEAIPAEYLTESEGDLRYELKGEGTGGQPSTGTTDPSGAPLYIGQIYINTTTKEAFIANSMAGDWQTISADELGGGAGSVDWTAITNKPNTFAPSAHTHLWADITDKPTTFAPATHTHLWADITDKPLTFAPSTHTHLWTDITDKPTTFAPSAHLHEIGDISGLTTALNGKVDDSELTAHIGSGGTAHAAATTSVNGFMTASDKTKLNGIATGATVTADSTTNGNILINGAETNIYSHPTGDGNLHVPATGTTNNNKVLKSGATAGSLSWASVDYAEVTGKPTTFAPSAHVHAWGDITTGKPTTLSGYGITDATPSSHIGSGGTAHAQVTTTVDGFMIASDKSKLDGIQAGANNYVHPATHPATMITEDATHRFTTDAEKTTWNAKLSSIPLMTGAQVGGAMVGNGLAMSGNYLYVKQGASLGIAGDNSLQVQTVNTTPTPIKFWTGSQATYDGLTKDPNTLYFISG